MLIPLGILAGAGGIAAGAYELIATATPNGSSPSIFFENVDSLANNYKHLQVRYVLRTVGTTKTNNDIVMRFQAEDTNYASHILYSVGSSVISSKDQPSPHMYLGQVPASGFTSNAFGVAIIDILDAFSTTKIKTIRNFNGNVGTANWINFASAAYFGSTNTITRIVIANADGANFTTTSRASLYGIKG